MDNLETALNIAVALAVAFVILLVVLGGLPERWFPVIGEPLARAEVDAWAITEEFSECQGCGAPVDPGAKRCRGGCRRA